MITPELVSYIRSQVALGYTQQTLMPSLVAQGWSVEDVEEAFESLTMTSAAASQAAVVTPTAPATPNTPPISAYPSATPTTVVTSAKKGVSIGKIILWVVIIGFLGLIAVGAIGAFIVYRTFSQLPNTVCSSVDASNREDCQKITQGFFSYFIGQITKSTSQPRKNLPVSNPNNTSSQASSQDADCSQGYTEKGDQSFGIGDMTDVVGINDPLICYYSRPADLAGVNTLTISISGTKNASNDTVKLVSEINKEKVTVYGSNGVSHTFEAATSTPIFEGLNGIYLNVVRLQIPLLQMCIKSTNWNTTGSWFTCDKVTFMGVSMSENDPSKKNVSAIKMEESNHGVGTSFVLETRNIKDGTFTADYIEVLRDGRHMHQYKTLTISSYGSASDLMLGKSIEQIISSNPTAQHAAWQYKYE